MEKEIFSGLDPWTATIESSPCPPQKRCSTALGAIKDWELIDFLFSPFLLILSLSLINMILKPNLCMLLTFIWSNSFSKIVNLSNINSSIINRNCWENCAFFGSQNERFPGAFLWFMKCPLFVEFMCVIYCPVFDVILVFSSENRLRGYIGLMRSFEGNYREVQKRKKDFDICTLRLITRSQKSVDA